MNQGPDGNIQPITCRGTHDLYFPIRGDRGSSAAPKVKARNPVRSTAPAPF
jgi:hypothetical protein